jgi:ligand-binding SRPBCC domain-containing protein
VNQKILYILRIKIETLVKGNYKDVTNRFDRDLFLALKPPLVQLDLKVFEGCEKGDKVEMELGVLGVKQVWKSLITEHGLTDDRSFFVDEGVVLPPPLKDWKHHHIMENVEDNKTNIIDDIQYSTGFKLLDVLIYPVMYAQFWYRKPIYKRYFN